ncbi:uncharacterized protein LOC127867906 isoform X2 [Dreissena polymorpha]|uniref:uncharacterized protein LOC127867906 isoform X2 n=1 Tax=Dreissena polymorpha TaxID=45954 RepID=UPI002263D5E0|nr:uncharacterized protein LOC127867906 isoform X2 [Dreissena polymorpha]
MSFIETHSENNSHTPFVAAKDRLICGSIKNEIETSQTCTSHVQFANKFGCLDNCFNCLEVYSKEGKMAAENQNGTDKILIEAKAHCPIHPSSTVSKCKFDEKTFYTDRHSVTEIKLDNFQDCIQISRGDFSESIEHRNMPKTAFSPNCEDNDDKSFQGKCKWSTDKELNENIIDATCKVTDCSCLRLADKVVNSCKEDIATCEEMHTCETNMDGLKLESVVKISTKTNKHENNHSLLHTVVTTSTKSESIHNSNEMEMGDGNFKYMRQLMGKLCVEDFQRTSSFEDHGRETNLTKNSRKESIKTYSRNNHTHDIKCVQHDAAYKACADRSHELPVRHVLVENREEACAQLINTVSEGSLLEACLESHLPEVNITEQTLYTMNLDESGVIIGEKLCVPGKRKVDHNFGPELGNSAECCTSLLEIPDITCATIDCTFFDVANGNLTNPSLHAANLVSDTCQSPQRAVYDTRKSMRHKSNENVEDSLANEIEASNNRCLNMIDTGVNKFANANTQGGLDPDVNFTENSDTATNVTDEITQQRVEILEHLVGKYENKHLSLGCAHQENCISETDRTDINWEVVDVKQCTPSVAVANAVQRLAVPECECSFDDALNSTTDTDDVQCANGNDLIHEHLSGKTLRREGILVANAVDVSFENRSKDDTETHIGNANGEHVQIAVALEDLTTEDIRLQVVNEELSFHMNIHSESNCQQSNCCSNSTNENVEMFDYSIANNVDEIHADIAGICGEVNTYETNTYKLCINGLQNDCSVITNNGPGISTSESFECNISTPIDSLEVQGNVLVTDESVFDRNETTHIPASEMGGLHAYFPDMLEETSVKVTDDYNVLSRQIDVETMNIECESLTVDRNEMTLCADAEIDTDDPIISLSSNSTAPTVDLHPSRNSDILPVVNPSHDHWATTVSYDNPTDEPPMVSLVSQYSGITVNLHPGRNRFLRPVYNVARAAFNDNSTDGPIISLASGITVDLHPGLNRFMRPVDHVEQAPLNDNSTDGPIVSLASVTSQSLPLPSLHIGMGNPTTR